MHLYAADCGIPVIALLFDKELDKEHNEVIQEEKEPIPVASVARKPIEVASGSDDKFLS
jgi:hypothetical protein